MKSYIGKRGYVLIKKYWDNRNVLLLSGHAYRQNNKQTTTMRAQTYRRNNKEQYR